MNLRGVSGGGGLWLFRWKPKFDSLKRNIGISGCATSWATAEYHSHQSNDTAGTSQQCIREPCKGKEAQGWTTDAEWTTYIQQYSRVDRRSQSAVSIFRVPNPLMKDPTKREAYVPTRVSLGPYHYRSEGLLSMKEHKPRALCRMMTRFWKQLSMEEHKSRALCRMMTRFHNVCWKQLSNYPNNMDFYVLARKKIVQLEDSIRNAYEEKIDHEKEMLAAILALDGSFILEILRALAAGDEASDYYEPIFEKTKILYTGQDILLDILKLENQIPFIVLRKLLDLEFNSAPECVQNELDLAVKGFLGVFYPFDNPASCIFPVNSLIQDEQVHHLLGLLHTLVLSPVDNVVPNREASKGNATSPVARSNAVKNALPRAVELRNAGIKFKRRDGGIKEIKFDQKSATISLPPINITDHTEVLFRNLIAFEMCCKPSGFNYVTWYVSLMDDLIDSEEDVALLRKMGILTTRLGSDAEVAQLFNGLRKGVTVDIGRAAVDIDVNLAQKVHAHYNNKFKVYSAEFVKEHLSSPWKIVALAGAILLLLLTAVQTIVAVLPFKIKGNHRDLRELTGTVDHIKED